MSSIALIKRYKNHLAFLSQILKLYLKVMSCSVRIVFLKMLAIQGLQEAPVIAASLDLETQKSVDAV